jgi:hypothetical protein
VAALLEVARASRDRPFGRTLRLVFFANEEPPFFASPRMDSWQYARASRARNDDLRAVIALDSIGRFSNVRGSQRYPAAVADKFPRAGNFLAFVTRDEDADLLRQAVGAFRGRTPVPSEGATMPSFVEGVWYSDHWSFWQFGYSGIMITDTAFFRWPEYHSPGDTIDRLDFVTLAHVTRGLLDIVTILADEKTPLKPGKRD